MKNHIRNHILYYLALCSIQIAGLILFAALAPNHNLQLSIAILTSFFYAVIGLLHHKMDHTLTTKIMLEYVIIPALGISVLFFYLI